MSVLESSFLVQMMAKVGPNTMDKLLGVVLLTPEWTHFAYQKLYGSTRRETLQIMDCDSQEGNTLTHGNFERVSESFIGGIGSHFPGERKHLVWSRR